MNGVLNERELERYRRQLMLDGFTAVHQEKLKSASVLVDGIGGLGGTAALYLAMAGIGKLVLAHYGNLTLSNMNRQVLMKHDCVGQERVSQARKTLNEINPDVEIEIYNERTTGDNVHELLSGASIALSARPNFDERRSLNNACVSHGVPLVEAAMNGMEGYIFNIIPGVTPCLNCLYPEDDPAWDELGFPVLGAVSGMLGCIMALEAIKIITAFGRPLISQMLVFNSADMDFRKFRIEKDNGCKVCAQTGHG